MLRRFSLPLLAVAPLLTGCVNNKVNRYSTDRAIYTDVPVSRSESGNHYCDLRLCFVAMPTKNGGPGALQRIIMDSLRPHFAAVSLQPTASPKDCDLGLKFDNFMLGDKADLYSTHTGEFLARFETIFRRMGALVCEAVKDGTPLFDKIPGSAALAHRQGGSAPRVVASAGLTNRAIWGGGSAQAPAAARTPAQGLSASDIQRIAQAVNAATPTAPAAPAAPLSPAPRFSAPERADDLAVIVGVESYSDFAAKAPYAERDAEAFKAHVRALGVPERNIVLLKGPKAGKAALEKNLEAWLPRLIKPDSRVYFYFSGHGAPDLKSGQAFLVPWDGDPNFLQETAYPVKRLYEKLGALPAKQVLVALDSCFSGAGGRSVLASGARPLISSIDTGKAPAKLTVLAASASSEISGSLDDKQHGAFTFFLLEALNAGKTTPAAIHAYLTPKVQDEARRLNRDQTPTVSGAADWTLR